MEIIKVSRIQAKEMFAIEAKENGYRVNNCNNHTPGFEVTYEDGSTSWFSVLEFNRLAIFTKKRRLPSSRMS